MSNEQTIRDLYAAFLRKDIAAIQALVADDVDWRNDAVASRECPWNGNFSGKANLPGFFQAVGQHMNIAVFEPKIFVSSGQHVVVQMRIEGKLTKNGMPLENTAVHFWTFNASGKVQRYQMFNDTAAEILAWRA